MLLFGGWGLGCLGIRGLGSRAVWVVVDLNLAFRRDLSCSKVAVSRPHPETGIEAAPNYPANSPYPRL